MAKMYTKLRNFLKESAKYENFKGQIAKFRIFIEKITKLMQTKIKNFKNIKFEVVTKILNN